MMPGPRIPRTLRGLGGVRLFDIPGVIYPKHVLQAEEGMDPRTGKPYNHPPCGTITTCEVAKMMKCSCSAARQCLKKNKVSRFQVQMPHVRLRFYWKKDEVKRLLDKRVPLLSEVPAQMMVSREVCEVLGISRASVYRYVRAGLLEEIKSRILMERGQRSIALYRRSQVKRLMLKLRNLRCSPAPLDASVGSVRIEIRP